MFDAPGKQSAFPLSPAELALGWPEGLQVLVENGCEVNAAFGVACWRKDIESATILLTTDRPIFRDLDILRSSRSNAEIFTMTINELQKRREAIKQLAYEHLTDVEQGAIGMPETIAQGDLNFSPLLQSMLAEKTNLPEKLECLGIMSPHCSYTLNHLLCDKTASVQQILYDAGFTDLDAPCAHGRTPLTEACEVIRRGWPLRIPRSQDEWYHLNTYLQWYVEKGASTEFNLHHHESLPRLSFYLADSLRMGNDFHGIGDGLTKVVQNEKITDNCNCYCSTYGCITPFWVWRCSWHGQPAEDMIISSRCHSQGCYEGHLWRRKNLQKWMKRFRMARARKEWCLHEISRLEIFERLGMAHTCCISTAARDELERDDIQAEDRDYGYYKQLLFLCRVYQRARMILSAWSIGRFWTAWWHAVNGVLPELVPKEACRARHIDIDVEEMVNEWVDELFDERSGERSGEWLNTFALACGLERRLERRRQSTFASLNGAYRGWEFDDILKYHMNVFLERAQAWRERRDCWKRHRLLARPKMRLPRARQSRIR
ncbi:hypothetical protein B0I35DRAFT_85888 [Stachybotrys elegans]|uniref:Uncharacterized protein n=1 Tax=Stachybotrys elegans TaxID=80388 RepID=A0A8K0SJJ4_9HYPO|nr:hypothetical protein B0I35DRAFT_85888 [Stachybotrys elegans]